MNTHVTADSLLLSRTAQRVRGHILKLATVRKVHIGSALSIVEILVALYSGWLAVSPDSRNSATRDRFLLSKGHGALALYAMLHEAGFLGRAVLEAFGTEQNQLPAHPSAKLPGVEFSTGSLGHGLAVGAGMALAARVDRRASRAVVLMGDGELNEGSVWEAAQFAAHQKLGYLTAIVDRNGLQQEGATEDMLALEPLADKWKAFGWRVISLDGHDFTALLAALRSIDDPRGQPVVIIARTIKGRGVRFMEGTLDWHMGILSPELYAQAMAQVGGGA